MDVIEGGDFRLVSDPVERYRHRSDGTWFCKTCGTPAETEHEKPECHRCSDWSGCGRDCTLSRVYCSKCGRSRSM
jgi:rubrerythrin